MADDSKQHGTVEGKQQPTPTSAAPAKQALSDEDKAKRYAELRLRLKTSRLETKPPVGKTGYWARKNDEGELGRLDYLGFSIVHDDPKSPRWKASGFKSDGTYQVADLILLEIDDDLYDLLLKDNAERSKNQIIGATESFKAEASLSKQRTGYEVPTFERGASLK